MRVLLSSHGKACLELGGNSIIKFLTVGPTHPVFDSMPRDSFYKEYNTVSRMTEDEAVLSFISVAKRAYKHNPEVCKFLWSKVMGKNFSEMSAEELIALYNKLARSVNKAERKAFSSKADAIQAIEKLDALIQEPTPVQLKHEGAKMTEVMTNEAGESVAVPTPKKTRGKGIGKRAMELILEGKSNQEVIDIIKSEIEDAHPTMATMAWYRNKLRTDGLLPKSERKSKAKEATPEVEAEADEVKGQDAEVEADSQEA